MGESQPQQQPSPSPNGDVAEDTANSERSPSARDSPEATNATTATTTGTTTGRGRGRTSLKKRSRNDSEAPSSRKRRRSDPDDSGSQAPAKSTRAQKHDKPDLSNTVESQLDGLDTSPYGTRSRNRGAKNRINYAEDDMDYEYTSTKRAPNGTRSQDVDEKPISIGGRRAAAARAAETAASSATASPAPSQPPLAANLVNGDGLSDSSPPSQPRKRKANANTSAVPPPLPRKSTQNSSSAGGARELGVLSFDRCKMMLHNGALVTDDKMEFRVNDFVYLVCEPPGEPYYIARLMEFVHRNGDADGPVDYVRVNWMYRPRDIARKATDSRLVFASMHADQSPVISLRGKCRVQHRARIEDLEAYRREKDAFYFSQMYERYMHRYYEVLPREKITNIASHLKAIINDQWDFIISESSKVKELTSASKTCKICGEYCPNNESVDCAVCKHTYHMTCIDPPLTKKPARGFAWSCGPCSRKQERKLEARNTPTVGADGDEDDAPDEEEAARKAIARRAQANSPSSKVKIEGGDQKDAHPLSKLWPWRYLGIHSKNEDLKDFDDRIHPRAGPRIGPRHQAIVPPWFGHPVEYPAQETRKKHAKNNLKKEGKFTKDTQSGADDENGTRTKAPWVQDRPPGYQERGLDLPADDKKHTEVCLFRLPEVGEASTRGEDARDARLTDMSQEEQQKAVEEYMKRAKQTVVQRRGKDKGGKDKAIEDTNTEVLDEALRLFYDNDYDADAAIVKFTKFIDKFNPIALDGEELRKFEEAVTKYGSSLMDITRHVKTVKFGNITRFYYTWKKTKRGREIWENYEGRKAKKETRRADKSGLVDDVADDADDSAFDGNKASQKKRGFECKFCLTRESRAWRRAPLTATGQMVIDPNARGKSQSNIMVALCQRCALLWRKYALHYENMDEMAKKIAASNSKSLKKRPEEDVFFDLVHATMAAGVPMWPATVSVAQSIGISVPSRLVYNPDSEANRKKAKLNGEKESTPQAAPPEQPKKKIVEKVVEPPLVPDPPQPKVLPCAVCREFATGGEELFSCRRCRMTVHRNCFGIAPNRTPAKWSCDTCVNDATSQNSTNYECVLCPTKQEPVDLYEQPKVIAAKKKTDREKEKERLEKDMVTNMNKDYIRKQEEQGRPTTPRDPLKATVGHKWMHVTCATFVSPIKFRDPQSFDQPEGLLSIPMAKFTQVCKICKTDIGVCVTCHKCPATFHVSCAQQHGYSMGFDVSPVKGSRRDAFDTITLGFDKESEKGSVEPVILCPDHPPTKSIIHPMNEATAEAGVNALQLYVRHFKLADPSLTGTVRKAALLNASRSHAAGSGHRGSISKEPPTPVTATKLSFDEPVMVQSEEVDETGDRIVHLKTIPMAEPVAKQCTRCQTETSPKWHKLPQANNVPSHDERQPVKAEFVCHRCVNPPSGRSEHRAPPSAPEVNGNHVPPPPPANRWIPNGDPMPPAPRRDSYPAPNGVPVVNGVRDEPPRPLAPSSVHVAPVPPPPPPAAPPHVAPHHAPAPHHAHSPHHTHSPQHTRSPHHGQSPRHAPSSHHGVPPPPPPSQRPGPYYDDYRARGPPQPIPPPPPQVNGHAYAVHHPPPPVVPPPPYHNTHHHSAPYGPPAAVPPPPPPSTSSMSPSSGYHRIGHGPSGPLGYGDDVFASYPAHPPPVHTYKPLHPREDVRRDDLRGPAPPPPPPPQAPKPKAMGASKDANLRNLMN